jgi:hypothetical protein
VIDNIVETDHIFARIQLLVRSINHSHVYSYQTSAFYLLLDHIYRSVLKRLLLMIHDHIRISIIVIA